MFQKIMARCGNDDDITSDITEQLKQNDLALREKDNDIQKLKAELAKQQN